MEIVLKEVVDVRIEDVNPNEVVVLDQKEMDHVISNNILDKVSMVLEHNVSSGIMLLEDYIKTVKNEVDFGIQNTKVA